MSTSDDESTDSLTMTSTPNNSLSIIDDITSISHNDTLSSPGSIIAHVNNGGSPAIAHLSNDLFSSQATQHDLTRDDAQNLSDNTLIESNNQESSFLSEDNSFDRHKESTEQIKDEASSVETVCVPLDNVNSDIDDVTSDRDVLTDKESRSNSNEINQESEKDRI